MLSPIRKARKKPIVLDYIVFTRDTWDYVREFTEGKARDLTIERCINGRAFCTIDTLEGPMIATEGDHIIKGVHGEYYACKPDIFAKTYDIV